ncbi:MAG: hypothetical protein ABJK37_10590 [Paraglaciecola sp.]|uniref:DUF7281 domain-containing protein n=1 Tax=Paraglaciecola sp. TaxID=1920173 RepID=UPI0032987BFB
MADDLSLKAKRLLAAQHHKLLFDEKAVANTSSVLYEILDWCDNLEFQPGKWLKFDKHYRFDIDYIAQINQTLLDEKYASIFDDFSQDTHRSAAQRNPNEKQGQLKPTQHLVLAAITDSAMLGVVQQSFYSSRQINIELDVQHLNLGAFDSLVVVENRDSFNDWFDFKRNVKLPKTLVVYRGDQHHSKACKTLIMNWLTTQKYKPAIYFGDYDLAGLRIAVSAGYTHILLPEYNWLSRQLISQHYPDNQQKYLARLEKDCPMGWQSLLLLLREKRAGLRQQKMYQTPLVTYPATI